MRNGVVYGSRVYKKLMKMNPTSPALTEKQVKEVYSRFGIRQYKNEEDFWSHRKKYSELQNTLDYQFYKHRDELIRSGQYQEWRAGEYKRQYVKTMKQYGIDSDIISTFENMPNSKFLDLYEGAKGRGQLPTISVYASEAITDTIAIYQWQKDLRAYLGMEENKEQHRINWIIDFFPRKYRDQIDYQKLRNAENPEAYLASILIRNDDFFATSKKTGKTYGFRRGWTKEHSQEVYKEAVRYYGAKNKRKKR